MIAVQLPHRVQQADLPRRIPDDQRVCIHIAHDDGTYPRNRSLAHFCARSNENALTQPTTTPDHDRLGLHSFVIGHGLAIIQVVIIAQNLDIIRKDGAIANVQATASIKETIRTEMTSLTKTQFQRRDDHGTGTHGYPGAP